MRGKIALTGATGFLGRQLLDSLIASGYEVICFARDKIRLLDIYPQLIVFELDITKKGDLDNLPVLKKLDAFFHLAAYIPPPQEAGADSANKRCMETNVKGTFNTLNYFNKCKGKKFIYSSSMCVYGKAQTNPVKERHPLKPVKEYGLSKLLGEHILQMHKRNQLIILRFPSIYGPERNSPFFIDRFIDSVMHDKDITIYGSGDCFWDNLYIKDAVQASLKAIDYKGKSEIFNIGSGSGITVKKMVNKIINIFSETKDIIKVTHDLGKDEDDSNLILDITKAKEELGYMPEYSFEEGLREIRSINMLKDSSIIKPVSR